MILRRAGLSLLEVMIAMSILLGSSILLVQLAGIGRAHASKADTLTTTVVLCHNKLNELLAGLAPLEAVESQPLIEAPGYVYSIQIQQVGLLDLVAVAVTVDQQEAQQAERRRSGEPSPRAFRLVRWIHASYPDLPDGVSPEAKAESGEELPNTFSTLN